MRIKPLPFRGRKALVQIFGNRGGFAQKKLADLQQRYASRRAVAFPAALQMLAAVEVDGF
jgi:hypothetical protein